MLLEAYPKSNIALELGREFDAGFLKVLIEQIAELRRSPEDRQREVAQEKVRELSEANQGMRAKFIDSDGEEIFFDL